MQQQMSVVTLGIDDVARSKRFYAEGFGWTPVFDNGEVVFYQMNGFVLGTWLRTALATDSARPVANTSGDFALAHNVSAQNDVEPLMDRLAAAGGAILRAAQEPPQGGLNGYVADPDGHAWEIAFNPAHLARGLCELRGLGFRAR
ncbi:VOC family protein [Brevundimonas goettingensis]|uniref:VOC family protein n=1 Tax=Brevundimonas goettingensis TaxID=2774190 RepID=A0A975C4Y2_9CAUL|nr:VOC family protein [Brevundimonas goettingensis]QTC92957.1 VOC family protein [Brevundimonas goettingensis]